MKKISIAELFGTLFHGMDGPREKVCRSDEWNRCRGPPKKKHTHKTIATTPNRPKESQQIAATSTFFLYTMFLFGKSTLLLIIIILILFFTLFHLNMWLAVRNPKL